MDHFILVASPFIVSLVTAGVKRLPVIPGGYRKSILQLVVAVLAYGSVVGGTVLSGGEIDAASTETFVNAIGIFLGATGVYFFGNKIKG